MRWCGRAGYLKEGGDRELEVVIWQLPRDYRCVVWLDNGAAV